MIIMTASLCWGTALSSPTVLQQDQGAFSCRVTSFFSRALKGQAALTARCVLGVTKSRAAPTYERCVGKENGCRLGDKQKLPIPARSRHSTLPKTRCSESMLPMLSRFDAGRHFRPPATCLCLYLCAIPSLASSHCIALRPCILQEVLQTSQT